MNSPSTYRASNARRISVALSWAAVFAVAAAIFLMSAKDGQSLDTDSGIISIVKAWLAQAGEALLGHPIDVSPIGHFAEYFLFGAVLLNALRWHVPARRARALAPLIASVYGVTDEIHQIFVPTRSCDPMDWLVDTTAAILGALLAFQIVKLLEARRSSHDQ